MAKVIGFLIGFSGSLYGAFVAWTGLIVPLVPAGDYHGIILLALGVLCFMVFGGLVFFVAMMTGVILASLFGATTKGEKA